LASEATFVAAVAAYRGEAAIFADQVPDDFVQEDAPCAVIRPASLDRPDDTFSSNGRYVEQRLYLYARRTGSSKAIEELAETVRSLFHDQAKALGVVNCTVLGPVDAPTTDPAVIGRQMTIQLTTQET
jgi:hypothetical protein